MDHTLGEKQQKPNSLAFSCATVVNVQWGQVLKMNFMVPLVVVGHMVWQLICGSLSVHH